MNRRGFLSQLFQTAGGIIVAPSIVTHGLKLKPYIDPRTIPNPDYFTPDHNYFETQFFKHSPWITFMDFPFPSHMGETIRSV
jgi:hypothetical protein